MDRSELAKTLERLKKLSLEKESMNIYTKTYRCEKCKDMEFLIICDEFGREVTTPCSCRKEREFERSLKASRITKKFANKTLDNFIVNSKNKKLYEDVKEFLKNGESEQKSILISGNVGSGKTHLGMAISNELLKKGKQVLYIEYRSFVTRVKQNIMDPYEYYAELNAAKEAEVLYIDDLYKGTVSEADKNVIYDIVNERYLSDMPMIITTEKSFSNLMYIDEAIASRIYEMANPYVLKSTSDNFRIKGE